MFGDFPGGEVVKNPPASVGDMGSIPGLGGSHMPQSTWAHAPQLLSLHSRAHVPQLLSPCATTTEARVPQLPKPARLEPMLHNKRSHHNKKPVHCNEK